VQPTGFDEVAMTGAYWITVDPFGRDLRAAAAFNGLIDADHQPTGGRKGRHQQTQQDATDLQTRPDVAIEHPMLGLEGGEMVEAQDAEDRVDHAGAGSEDGAHHSHERMAPDRPGEHRRKRRQNSHNIGRQGKHRQLLW